MKITTTFIGSDKQYEFSELLFINGNTEDIFFSTNFENKLAVFSFFKALSRFVGTKVARESIREDSKDWFQFAVILDGKVTPIKWFNIILSNCVISHDIAFQTTLIIKNGKVVVPFGRFPFIRFKNRKWRLHDESKMKRNAYKYIANNVLK